MKHLLMFSSSHISKALLVVTMLVYASMASAQGGSIGLFSDSGGANCNLPDTTPGLCSVFIVHVNAPAVTASEFAITSPACILATFLACSTFGGPFLCANPFLPEGISIGYGGCLASPIHFATLVYFCQGLTPPCCLQSVVPHGVFGAILAVDCASNVISATGGSGIWNSDPSCSCAVGTHSSTWGQVKSMYQ